MAKQLEPVVISAAYRQWQPVHQNQTDPDGHFFDVQSFDADIPPQTRQEALAQSNLLDSDSEESFDRLTRLAMRTLAVPVVLMSLVDDRRQFFKSAQGLAEPWATARETPLSHSFCQHVVNADAALIVEDARRHPELARNGATTDIGVVAYLGIPLHYPGGHVLGSFCAIDDKPRAWTAEDEAVLRDYAALVEHEIRSRLEIQRRRSAEEKAALVARELSHRIKNIFTVISSLVSLSSRGHPEAAALAETVSARIEALARAHDYVQPDPARSDIEIDSHSLLGLIETLMKPYAEPGRMRVTISGSDAPVGVQSGTTLALVLHELATNAVKYGALSLPAGRVIIQCEGREGCIVLNWTEHDGPVVAGPPTQQGFGTILSQRAASRQLNAKVTHDWHPHGLNVTMTIPLEKLAQ